MHRHVKGAKDRLRELASRSDETGGCMRDHGTLAISWESFYDFVFLILSCDCFCFQDPSIFFPVARKLCGSVVDCLFIIHDAGLAAIPVVPFLKLPS